jgi:thioredoxin reductase (NADPH)
VSQSSDVRNVIIIGSGPAGLTASIYAARANLKPLLIEGFSAGGLIPGGQLMFTSDVENYPGFPEKVTGQELMQRFREQAEKQGTEIVTADVTRVDFKKHPFEVWVEDDLYLAKSVIIATGAQSLMLGLPEESRLLGHGLSTCATCDGFFFRGKSVAVVGGGNTAVEEALFLTNFAERVTLVHRRDSLRAEKLLQERLFANPKVSVIWDSVVDDILGTDNPRGVTGVRLRHRATGALSELAVDGVFIAIGHTPATELFRGQVRMDDEGYILTRPDSTATDIPGVYAAGDVKDKVFRQAVTAAGMGCMAALEAERFLAAGGAAGGVPHDVRAPALSPEATA